MKKFWTTLMQWAEAVAEHRRRSQPWRGYY